jgi:hypothetical protein
MPTQFCPECCNAHDAAATAFIDSTVCSAVAALISCVPALPTVPSALEFVVSPALYCLRKCRTHSFAAERPWPCFVVQMVARLFGSAYHEL